ncbi:4'-phosphopantetheinyl transferase family protein [Algibacter mikhailovii]|uniref:4'-phosphopantetheinyl transferase n=1 Tax=Algibacter mikhailovii TaxID=425498 RepID=A0A918QW34_9FLAO|nr:4'-phosphopantetheinyl transferase superfamily protein [Algibacter mikhailovii]GGZ71083.1 4'-phosphopantetheinyl transferase [Algibacter mikhailovii]
MNFLNDKTFHILNTELHLWYISLNETFKYINFFNNILSQDEIIKASKFRFDKDKNCSIITRGALRLLSGMYLNMSPENILFKYGDYGKPDFDIETELKFNVSHSGNMAIIGFVLNKDIGVDIEKIKYDFEVMDIVDNYFSQLEIESLKKLPIQEHNQGFYRCWTRKESFIKAKSQGLSFALDSFSVSLDSDDKAQLLETHWNSDEKESWGLFSFSPDTDYLGAVTVQSTIEQIEYFNFNSYLNKLSNS